jgi:hypothetical protein
VSESNSVVEHPSRRLVIALPMSYDDALCDDSLALWLAGLRIETHGLSY